MPGGRPLKNGVDYFPLDVIMDDKCELIEAEHGVKGFGIMIKLFQKIYSNNYWINWDKKTSIVFSKRINVSIEYVNNVINSCVEWEIFNKKIFEKLNILTSSGIQKRFFEIVRRRKVVEFRADIMLIDIDVNAYNSLINVNINSDNDDPGGQAVVINADISKQRKGKERKGKESNKKPSCQNPPKKSQKKVFGEGSDEFKISIFLFAKIKERNPGHKHPNLQSWAEGVDKMIRLDKRSVQDIYKVVTFSQQDNFWKNNILSIDSLRKQFDKLILKSGSDLPKPGTAYFN